ncbi:MAG: hydroxylamine reductase, partial [Chlorobaculum sp.]|nr:hydroxylamine reductase [Chlorobaculum sp.]
MSMHCDQCQESIKGTGCNVRGVCGKDELTAKLQDTLVYAAEGIALCAEALGEKIDRKYGQMISECLFVTVTNTNFDDVAIVAQINKALAMRDEVKALTGVTPAHDAATWSGSTREEFLGKVMACTIDSMSDDADLRSLKSLVLYGIKGLAAYTDHAAVLGYHDDDIYSFYVKGLAALLRDHSADELLGLVMETGATAVKAMALLDKANTETYGNPEITTVNIGVGTRPGILISGHDLRDMEDLLKQTEGTGVDVY